MSTAPAEEKLLATHAVSITRSNGGCLEHPRNSLLWREAELPTPADGLDEYGGFTLALPQFWWGHPAFKASWIYCVGLKPKDVPPVPLVLGEPLYTVATAKESRATMHARGLIGEMKKSERDVTPYDFAKWLLSLARKTHEPK